MLPESAKPYLLRAVYDWCLGQGHTPYVVVSVSYPGLSVPSGYDRDGRIILDISPRATHSLHIADGWITFSARFGGAARSVEVPIGAVMAIYAAETQEGMGFGEPTPPSSPPPPPAAPKEGEGKEKAGRSRLRVVK